MTPRVALTVAGSDSGGGAGIQADLKTFAALGVFGTSAVTAVTAQHTAAVLAVVALEPPVVVAQIEAVLDDLAPAAVKTGMLANGLIVAAVSALAAAGRLPNLVVDPVLVSTSGDRLMEEQGVDAYRRLLLPWATVVTPNIEEAAVLTGRRPADLSTVDAMAEAGEELRLAGAAYVVVKGGHATTHLGHAPDVLVGPEGVAVLDGPRIATRNDHGTGCSMSAAVAARLALGDDPSSAVAFAKEYVRGALAAAAGWELGSGHGPIDHFWCRTAADDPSVLGDAGARRTRAAPDATPGRS